jgi:preprotein translocase subunit SecG
MTTAILIALNVIAGLFLVAVVLLQAGKGADMGAAFGGANPAVFGPTGQGNVLQRITAATAVVFMGTSLALAVISARQESIFDGTAEPPPLAAPVVVPGTADSAPADENAAAAPADSGAGEQAAPSDAGLGDAVPTPEPGAVEAPAATPPVAPPSSDSPAAATPPTAAEPPPAAAVQ